MFEGYGGNTVFEGKKDSICAGPKGEKILAVQNRLSPSSTFLRKPRLDPKGRIPYTLKTV
jgi:hypothetical protein